MFPAFGGFAFVDVLQRPALLRVYPYPSFVAVYLTCFQPKQLPRERVHLFCSSLDAVGINVSRRAFLP
jgi:hypothetical protein